MGVFWSRRKIVLVAILFLAITVLIVTVGERMVGTGHLGARAQRLWIGPPRFSGLRYGATIEEFLSEGVWSLEGKPADIKRSTHGRCIRIGRPRAWYEVITVTVTGTFLENKLIRLDARTGWEPLWKLKQRISVLNRLGYNDGSSLDWWSYVHDGAIVSIHLDGYEEDRARWSEYFNIPGYLSKPDPCTAKND